EEVSNILDVWRTGDELQVTARDAIRTGRFRVDLKKKELGPAAPGSEDWSRPALVAKLPPDFTTDSGLSSWQDKQGGGAVFGGDLRERKGLWLMRKDAVPEFLAAGSFTDELVSPDGKWCVAAKPKGIVRINLETKEVFPVDLAAADGLKAVAYLTPRKKFLLVWPVSVPVPGKDPETRQEYCLLDPVTGESEPLAGDYRAFPGYEAAQPAGTRDEMWGGVDADLADDGTLVGRLNGQTLLFQPVWQVKGLSLNAATIWVDEKREILYAAKNGDLLKIDLKGMKIPAAKK
ncbi:MAG: hypothetical protein JWO82_2144, partial [Akkermansiaceae bacterium]|nr:hypothetical protein [Akkermansiaceae bacterium]